jgi:hypothetical protein
LQEMSDVILYLQRPVTRIPSWMAAPTASQTHCKCGRPQDFVAGTRVPRSGLPRVSVRSLACISMQTFGGRCRCTPNSQPPTSTCLVCCNRSTGLRPSPRGTPCATGATCRGERCVVQYTTGPVDPSATVRTTTHADAGACEARESLRGRETWRLRLLPHACPPRASPFAHSAAFFHFDSLVLW